LAGQQPRILDAFTDIAKVSFTGSIFFDAAEALHEEGSGSQFAPDSPLEQRRFELGITFVPFSPLGRSSLTGVDAPPRVDLSPDR
jgi:hypothetical protein